MRFSLERWNGAGFPDGVRGRSIPLPMRVVQLSQDVEAISRIQGGDSAIETARARSARSYDPDVVDTFVPLAGDLLDDLDALDPWDAVLAGEPHRAASCAGRRSTKRCGSSPISST